MLVFVDISIDRQHMTLVNRDCEIVVLEIGVTRAASL